MYVSSPQLWLILAENKLSHLDWKKTSQFCFNERSNPDDDNLGAQIVKVKKTILDIHGNFVLRRNYYNSRRFFMRTYNMRDKFFVDNLV